MSSLFCPAFFRAVVAGAEAAAVEAASPSRERATLAASCARGALDCGPRYSMPGRKVCRVKEEGVVPAVGPASAALAAAAAATSIHEKEKKRKKKEKD